jgi:hypothetical protein
MLRAQGNPFDLFEVRARRGFPAYRQGIHPRGRPRRRMSHEFIAQD